MGCFPSSKQKSTPPQKQVTLSTPKAISTKEELKINAANFVTLSTGSIRDNYDIGQILGEGAFGSVRVATHKLSHQRRAIKSIKKSSITRDMTQQARFFAEVDILRSLDHPNIVKLFEFYEDEKHYHLVTELMQGGELFDFIVKSKMLTEPIAAHFMRQILSAVLYCHERRIVHRDLKPENLLLETEAPDANIKVIDFGTSGLYDPQTKLTKKYGTAYYIAPEVIKREYNEKCDVWSCGVILYILLSGKPPFFGREDNDIIQRVQRGIYSMKGREWDNVSNQAKRLISRMLRYNPDERISIAEALNDAWITTYSKKSAFDQAIILDSLNNMKQFRTEQKMQQAVMTFIATQLVNRDELQQLTESFKAMDTNGDGKLSREELLLAYRENGSPNAEEEVDKILRQVDSDGSGYIDYSEYIAASMQHEKMLSKQNLESAFAAFDKDGSGTISAAELRAMLGDEIVASNNVWNDIISEVDQNGDGEIDIVEFKEMMIKLV